MIHKRITGNVRSLTSLSALVISFHGSRFVLYCNSYQGNKRFSTVQT